MIPRYQRILFMILFGSSLLMVTYLVYLHQQTSQVKNADNTPLQAPAYSASEEVTFALANDADGSVTAVPRSVALPQQPAVRARALLDHLLAEYTLPHTTHLIGGGVAVDDVFLVNLPLGGQHAVSGTATALDKDADVDPLTRATGELAIVNLRSSWADAHPSGITAETLTIQSIVGTLHANLPEITKVRFLVDGKPRSTLAGNVVFDRTYDADTMMVGGTTQTGQQ
jgi:hypothetical protein